MTKDNQTVGFTYDANGMPLTMKVGEDTYYYVTNIQGDVMALVDGDGNTVVSYAYTAYGEVTLDGDSDIIALNPLTYRGYVYDVETKLFYLQSRYYDPEIGRFLNADDPAYLGAGGLVSFNLFAYCGNNPVINYDKVGYMQERNPFLHKGFPGFSPEGGIEVIIDGVVYLYYAYYKGGYLWEVWADLTGRAVRIRHHTIHTNSAQHSNPHDHVLTQDGEGNDTLSGPLDVDDNFQSPGKNDKNKDSTDNNIAFNEKLNYSEERAIEFIGIAAVSYALYEILKWGIAAATAPATAGGSIGVAAALP